MWSELKWSQNCQPMRDLRMKLSQTFISYVKWPLILIYDRWKLDILSLMTKSQNVAALKYNINKTGQTIWLIYLFRLKTQRANITLLNNVGSHSITMRCYEFNLKWVYQRSFSSISLYIMRAHGMRVERWAMLWRPLVWSLLSILLP